MTAWSWFRLLLAFALCAAAAFAVFRAPTLPLFRVALIATEFGHWLVLAPLLLILLPASRSIVGHAGTALALLAGAFFLSSAVRAVSVARRLPAEMAQAFPGLETSSARPFSWRRLWFPLRAFSVPVETHEYARPDGQPLHLLLYRSAKSSPAPCVIVIHGGGWDGGSPDEFPALHHHLARQRGPVAALEYRLAPRSPWPAKREDVLAALRYLKERATEFGIDPQRFVLLGRSAGGQIAEAVAYGAHDPAIRGCIAFYAPADLHFAYEFAREDDILNSFKLLRQYLAGNPGEAHANYDSASGILLAAPTSPPTLLIHGRRDELVWFRQSERLAARLQTLGTPHYFLPLPWATHAFDYNPHGPGGQLSTYAVETFLRAVTR